MFTLNRSTILKNVISLFSGTFLAQIGSFITLFLTARVLGKDAYGAYISCFVLTRLAAILFSFGFDTWMLKQGGSEAQAIGWGLGTGLFIKSALGSIWLLIFWFVPLFLDGEVYPVDLLRVTAVATLSEGLYIYVLTGFKSILQNQKTALLTIVNAFVILVSTWVLSKTEYAHSPITYAGARAMISFLLFVVGFLWLTRDVQLTFHFSKLNEVFKDLFPFLLSDGLVAIYTSADVLIITQILGKGMAGLYAPASSIVAALFIIPQSIHTVLVPVMSRMIRTQSKSLFLMIYKSWIVFSLLGGGLWLSINLFSDVLVHFLLGADYLASIPVLRILSSVIFLKSGSFAMITILIAAHQQRQRTMIQAIAAFANVLINLLVVNRFGITGEMQKTKKVQ